MISLVSNFSATVLTLTTFLSLCCFSSFSDTPITSMKASTSISNVDSSILREPQPPQVKDVEWLKIPYDKAENEVLSLLQRDLPKIAESANDLAIYEVRTSGQLPVDYHRTFRSKLERVILTSKNIKVKQCINCEESRLYKTDSGELRYESFSTDPARPAQIASQIGVGHLVYCELAYSPEDLQLRVRVTKPTTGEILWSKDYSTADVVKTRQALNDSDPDELGHRDSFSRVMIGEIAFTTVLSPGVSIVPSIDVGNGSQLISMPAVDIFIGERYDRGRKFFGFQIGAGFNMTGASPQVKPLPWMMKVGPKIGYVFNPYNTTTARYSITGELGGIISTGLATGYIGIGPEVTMIHRFSVSLTPIYAFKGSVTNSQTLIQQDDNTFTSTEEGGGKWGGLGILAKACIHW
jgi:hypothetical protein